MRCAVLTLEGDYETPRVHIAARRTRLGGSMPDPTSAKELDLSPIPRKKYFTIDREWREEFIYFLIVDRFQDDIVRPTSVGAGRAAGINTPNTFFGGNIKGITRNLDYIAGLGCTAIWLSPVFENNPGAYHGYDINNYLRMKMPAFVQQLRGVTIFVGRLAYVAAV